MNRNFFKNSFFVESRLLFKTNEKAPVISDDDKKKAEVIGKGAVGKAHEKAKTGAIEKGKGEAIAVAGGKPKENFTFPEIPAKLTGLKIDSKEAKIDKAAGTIEQPFKFGDFNIKGKILMPDKPEPGKPVTYLFNYVDDPEKFNSGKFMDELKKRKEQLGNTVIITLKTPEGETKVDQKKVNTMAALVGDIERFQADLDKDPKYAGLKLPRAEKMLYMTSEDAEAPKVKALLSKYSEAAAKKDSRILQFPALISNNPDRFVETLDKILQGPETAPQEQPGQQPQQGGAPGGAGPKGGGGMGGGGGPGGGSGMGGVGSPGGSTSDSPSGSPSGSPSDVPAPQPGNPESKETSTGLDKLLVLGDSLMVGGERGLKANDFIKTQSSQPLDIVKEAQDLSKDLDQRAVGGWAVNQMLSLFQKMEKAGKLERYRNQTLLMDGGVNDIAGGQSADQIIGNMQKVWALARKFNMKVFCCTLTPFKGAKGWKDSLLNGYEEKEKTRNTINDRLIAMAGTSEGPDKIIALHKKASEGGLADDNDPSALAPQYAAGDKLHLTGAGNTQMTKAIQDVLGLPVAPGQQPAATPNGVVTKVEGGYKINGYKVTPADVKASDAYLAEINAGPNPEGRIGETRVLPGGDKIMRVAWHPNHKGQWGINSGPNKMEIIPGRHVGVQVEPNPDAQKKKPELVSAQGNIERLNIENGRVSTITDYPSNYDPNKPTEIIFYATPNGSHAENSYGTNDKLKAQIDRLRSSPAYQNKNLVLVVASPDTMKWSVYNKTAQDRCLPILQEMTQRVRDKLGTNDVSISIDSHSGGGFFAMNIMDNSAEIPAEIHSIDFFDSLYWYNGPQHAGKLLNWLKSDSSNRLNLVSGTPPVYSKQNQLISDLKNLGIEFYQGKDDAESSEITALNGQISIRSLKRYSHGGTISWNGMAATKDPQSFDMKVA